MKTEVFLIIIGAAIGFVSSIGTILAERMLNNSGRIRIYYKFIHSRTSGNRSWGVYSNQDNLVLEIPVVFEFQNTSNTTRVIRDVAIYLYKGNAKVLKMIQMENLEVTHRKGNEVTGVDRYNYGGENGTYSFVLPPRSIQRQECEFLSSIKESNKKEMEFNCIKIGYYDERDKFKLYVVKPMPDAWDVEAMQADQDWIQLK